MRLVLAFLLLSSPVWAQTYPPELPPLTPPERALRAWGFLFEDPAPDVAVGDPVEVTVLVAVASGVSCGFSAQGVDRTNTTTVNSAQGHIRFRLVGCMVTGYVSSGSASTDLNRLQLQSDGFLDAVHPERNRVAADLVLLIGKSADSCGLAFLLAGATSAFAYVLDSCLSNSSFEHELGHLFGMHHDRPNAGGATASGYGYGKCFGNGRKDVLTYPSPCGGTRAPYYSNPAVLDAGTPTGTATEDNARMLREHAPRIAAFRSAAPAPRPAGIPVLTEDE